MTAAEPLKVALDVIVGDRELPPGYDEWAIRTVRADLTSRNDYRYPFPGKVAKAAGPFSSGTSECPRYDGDGICAATTYAGMASGGVPARTILLVAYRNRDLLGGTRSGGKVRLKQFKIVDVLDGERLARADLARADLGGADLGGANLARADLGGADLGGAYLGGAYLGGADLGGAYLGGANLARADLGGADLGGADLGGAYLGGAIGLKLPEGWKLTDSGLAVRA